MSCETMSPALTEYVRSLQGHYRGTVALLQQGVGKSMQQKEVSVMRFAGNGDILGHQELAWIDEPTGTVLTRKNCDGIAPMKPVLHAETGEGIITLPGADDNLHVSYDPTNPGEPVEAKHEGIWHQNEGVRVWDLGSDAAAWGGQHIASKRGDPVTPRLVLAGPTITKRQFEGAAPWHVPAHNLADNTPFSWVTTTAIACVEKALSTQGLLGEAAPRTRVNMALDIPGVESFTDPNTGVTYFPEDFVQFLHFVDEGESYSLPKTVGTIVGERLLARCVVTDQHPLTGKLGGRVSRVKTIGFQKILSDALKRTGTHRNPDYGDGGNFFAAGGRSKGAFRIALGQQVIVKFAPLLHWTPRAAT